MKTSVALYLAADYIREHGWRRGIGRDGGPRCMVGALMSVAEFCAWETLNHPAYRALVDVVGGGLKVGEFNDKHCKTKRDAIAALTIAADIAHAEGK